MILDLQLFDFQALPVTLVRMVGRPYQGQTTDRKIKQYNKDKLF